MSRTLELIYNGIQWTVGVMRRAVIPDNDMRFVGDKIKPSLGNTGLADAGLTAKKRDLTFAGLGPLPEGRHLLQFTLPPYEFCKLRRLACDESHLDRLFPRDLVSSYRPQNSVKLRVVVNEHVTEELTCARGDGDRVWGRYVPQSGSRDNGFSDGSLIFADKD